MPYTTKKLDPFNYKLKDISIVEASAGTGKTYAIVNLFLKAILNCGDEGLDKAIDHKEILLVTFTNAAVAELKERIEHKLKDLQKIVTQAAVVVLSSDSQQQEMIKLKKFAFQQEDDFFKSLLNEYASKPNLRKELLNLTNKLDLIISEIDQLSIFTIDKFFRKCLERFSLSNPNVKIGEINTPVENKIIQSTITNSINNVFKTLDYTQVANLVTFTDTWVQGYDSIYINPPAQSKHPYIRIKDSKIYNDGSSSKPTDLYFEANYFKQLISEKDFFESGSNAKNLINLSSYGDIDFNQFIQKYNVIDPNNQDSLITLTKLINDSTSLTHSLAELSKARKSVYSTYITSELIVTRLTSTLAYFHKQARKSNQPLVDLQKIESQLKSLVRYFLQKMSSVLASDKYEEIIDIRYKEIDKKDLIISNDSVNHDLQVSEIRNYHVLAELTKLVYMFGKRLNQTTTDFLDSFQFDKFADLMKNQKTDDSLIGQINLVLKEIIQDSYAVLDSSTIEYFARQEFILVVGSIRKQIQQEMSDLNITSYKKASNDLRWMLENNSNDIVTKLQKLYPFMMIDEFQDTSAEQYKIFAKIYFEDPSKVIGALMIGDPKQSIYGFRGSDLDSYFKAKNEAKSIYTLGSNYRSNETFINALNNAFSRENSFRNNELQYNNLAYGGKSKGEITYKGKVIDPMAYYQLNQSKSAQNFQDLKYGNYDFVASLIGWMIQEGRQGNLQLNGKNLVASDIAVIGDKNKELNSVKSFLDKMSINSLIDTSKGSDYLNGVFDSLGYLVTAINDYNNVKAIGDFVLSDLSLMSLQDAMKFKSPEGQTKELIEFQKNLVIYNKVWEKQGFSAFVSYYLQKTKLVAKAKQQMGGDKIIADFFAITDWIERELELSATPEKVLSFIKGQKAKTITTGQEYKTRIANLENVVTLITIHSSKGLEYPIVFLLNFNDSTKLFRSTLDFMYESISNFEVNEKELRFFNRNEKDYKENLVRQEKLRLYYVALSRAKYGCYIFTHEKIITDPKLKEGSLGYLVNNKSQAYFSFYTMGEEINNENNIICEFENFMEKSNLVNNGFMNRKKLINLLTNKQAKQAESQLVRSVALRRLAGRSVIGSSKSFSSIISDDISVDRDHFSQIEKDYKFEVIEQDLSSIVKESSKHNKVLIESDGISSGTSLGLIVHEIFESIKFWAKDDIFIQHIATIKYICNIHGLNDDKKIERLAKWLNKTVQNKIVIEGNEWSLRNIVNDDNHKSEWKFSIKVKPSSGNFTKKSFNDLLRKHQWGAEFNIDPDTLDLGFKDFFGYLVGFVDLLIVDDNGKYWIVDYKTNFLGHYYEDYNKEAIKKGFFEHRYDIQLLFYSLAVHNYLSKRVIGYDYDKHIAGGLYLFLRGMGNSDVSESFHFMKPSKALIEELSNLITEEANGN